MILYRSSLDYVGDVKNKIVQIVKTFNRFFFDTTNKFF